MKQTKNVISLEKIDTGAPKKADKDLIKGEIEVLTKKLGELQNLLYAEKKHSILIVLQGMDGSGKDGIIRKVFSNCSPAGILPTCFKKPTETEMAHDFLWRIHQAAPPKGYIGIFNRSHYEDVLIQRVHKWIDEDRVAVRFNAINSFEQLLRDDNNTVILKFFLYLSKEKQSEKLQERIDNPEENWKHNAADWGERQYWNEYMKAYEDVLNKSVIPWYIVPCDQKWYRDYYILKVMVDELEKLHMKFPLLDPNVDPKKWD